MVAVLAPQLPGADPERLAAQIEALKLLPAHARGLLAHLRAHPDALSSGEATGPAALRTLLDVLAPEHPAVQRMRCHRCGAQRALPYRRDGASTCGRCYAQTHLKVCVRCGELSRPDSREDGGIVCSRCKVQDPARRDACTGCGKTMRVAYRVGGKPFCQTCGPRKLYTCSACGQDKRSAHAFTAQGPLCSTCYHRRRENECVQCGRNLDLLSVLGTSHPDVQPVRSSEGMCQGECIRSPDLFNLPRSRPPPTTLRPVRAHRRHPDHAAARAGMRTLLPAASALSGRLRQLPGNPPAGRRR